MRIAIYGAGFIGKRTAEYIGDKYISVFIDQDEKKQNKYIEGIKVVSLEEYIANYNTDFIILAVSDWKPIGENLIKKNIYHFTVVTKMPTKFAGYGFGDFEADYKELINNMHETDVLYGCNAFSLLLLLLAKSNKDYSLQILPESWVEKEMYDWFAHYTEIVDDFCNNQLINTINDAEMNKHKKDIKDLDIVVNAFRYIENNMDVSDERIRELKNKYIGKRCFIVATGPSLIKEDLFLLKQNNEFIFSMNKIYKFMPDFDVNAYVCTDRYFINNSVEEILRIKSQYKFIGEYGDNYWNNKDSAGFKIRVLGGESLGFSEDISRMIFGGYTVTNVCIQIAIYMGFSEIYLLGVDCNYQRGSTSNYAYKEGKIDNQPHNVDGMIRGYIEAEKYANAHGIKIYNATRGGMLEVFERVDFDLLFQK